jgi:mono/diheme cytochrome c family protein
MKRIVLLAAALVVALALTACGGDQEVADTGLDPETLATAQRLYQANCLACHSDKADVVLVGPSMVGLAERAGEMVPGLDARAYIEESILDPEAYLNEGYNNLMPATYGAIFSEEELDALVDYLMTFE